MYCDSDVNRDGMKEGTCSHPILGQIKKTLAEFFVYVYFPVYYTESDGPHGFKDGGLHVRAQLKGNLFEGGGLN